MFKLLKVFMVLLIAGLFSVGVNAQELCNVRSWGANEEIPSRKITCITEDNDGYIWIGTQSGLIRFDGRSFVPFADIHPEHSVSSDRIFALTFRDSVLWVSTEQGLFTISTHNYAISKFNLPFQRNSKPQSTAVSGLLRLKSNDILVVGGREKFWIINPQMRCEVVSTSAHEDVQFGTVVSLVEDHNGNVWMTAWSKKVFCISPRKKQLLYCQPFDQYLCGIGYTNAMGVIVVGTKHSYRIDTSTNQLSQIMDPTFDKVNQLIQEEGNSFWLVKSRKQFFLCTPQQIKSVDYIFDRLEEKDFTIRTVFRSRGHLWIGTDYGLIKANIAPATFEHYFSTSTKSQGIRSVRGMCEDNQKNLYFGSYIGLFKIPYPYNNSNIEPVVVDSITTLIPYALSYKRGKIWIGTEGGGLAQYDLTTKKLKSFNMNVPGLTHKYVLSISQEFRPNHLLLGTYSGIVLFNEITSKFTVLDLNMDPINFNDANIYQITKVGSSFWLCTNKGLLQCDADMKPVKQYSFISRSVFCMAVDTTNNCFWIGTGNGLYRFHSTKHQIHHYSIKEGLPDNDISSLVLANNKLWIGTFAGLSQLNIANQTFTNLHTEQGLSHNEFNRGASFISSTGQLFMGGINGYNMLPTQFDFPKAQTSEAKPRISSLYMLNGKNEVHLFHSELFSSLTIPSNNKVIEFELGLADYYQPERNRFAYKIEGLDKDWVNLGTRNYVRLTGLKSGTYQVHIKASGNNGAWTLLPNAMTLHVDAPFYKTWWFGFLIVLMLSGAFGIYHSIRLRQLKKLYKLRLQISSDLHDEVGGILTAVGMQAELLQNEINPLNNNLKGIAETSRLAVSNMRDVIWSINSQQDKFEDLVDRMHEYLTFMFEGSTIEYHFAPNINTRKETLDMVTRQNIYLIFKEAINNIVKHSNAREVKVELNITDQYLELNVLNNGTPQSIQHKGMGLKNMEMRAKKMNAAIHMDIEGTYSLRVKKMF